MMILGVEYVREAGHELPEQYICRQAEGFARSYGQPKLVTVDLDEDAFYGLCGRLGLRPNIEDDGRNTVYLSTPVGDVAIREAPWLL